MLIKFAKTATSVTENIYLSRIMGNYPDLKRKDGAPYDQPLPVRQVVDNHKPSSFRFRSLVVLLRTNF